jgi:hypothetical protein
MTLRSATRIIGMFLAAGLSACAMGEVPEDDEQMVEVEGMSEELMILDPSQCRNPFVYCDGESGGGGLGSGFGDRTSDIMELQCAEWRRKCALVGDTNHNACHNYQRYCTGSDGGPR